MTSSWFFILQFSICLIENILAPAVGTTDMTPLSWPCLTMKSCGFWNKVRTKRIYNGSVLRWKIIFYLDWDSKNLLRYESWNFRGDRIQLNFLGQTAASRCEGFPTFRQPSTSPSSECVGGLVVPKLMIQYLEVCHPGCVCENWKRHVGIVPLAGEHRRFRHRKYILRNKARM